MPVQQDDVYLNTAMIQKIRNSINEIEHGEVVKAATAKEVSELLDV